MVQLYIKLQAGKFDLYLEGDGKQGNKGRGGIDVPYDIRVVENVRNI